MSEAASHRRRTSGLHVIRNYLIGAVVGILPHGWSGEWRKDG